MEELIAQYRIMLENTPMDFFREKHEEINWNVRILGILGQRGVGKSTLILQHIKKIGNIHETLYVQADDIYFGGHTLVGLAKEFYAHGGKELYIDEIHKYREWSREIKMIYDLLPNLKVVYSGSSLLALKKEGADLSRRVIEYHLPEWSFREFLNLRNNWNLKTSTLEDILSGKVDFPYGEERPLKYFVQYMKQGCYPFFKELEFYTLLRQIINNTVENDIPTFAGMTVAATQKLKKLMYFISTSVPNKVNYSEMAKNLEIDREIVAKYLEYLERAELVNLLRTKANGDAVLRKADKLYLHNPNIAYVFGETDVNKGNLRESIFLCWTKEKFEVLGSEQSDFEIDGYTFEIGGKTKGKHQLRGATNGYIIKDNIEYAVGKDIPLWMFGFLY